MIIPFQFDNQPIRVVTDDSGEPLFVGKDICQALGYKNPTDAMNQRCKGVAKRYPLQTAGGLQELRVLSEPDVLRLIVSSTLPAAEAFERLVFEEILPTIRRTGSYSVTKSNQLPATVAAEFIKAELDLAALFSVPLHLAQVEAVKSAKNTIGYDATRFLLLAPAQTNVPTDEMRLEPTELGKMFGVSAIRVNRLLEEAGLQKKVALGWEPTGEGKLYASSHQWVSGSKSGYNLKWDVRKVRSVMETAKS